MAGGDSFRDITVNQLVDAAGLARSTFYLNFDDKAAMLRTLSATSLARLYVGARAWIHLGADATRADIAAAMRQIIDAFLEDHAVMRAVAEAAVYEPTVRDDYVKGVEAFAGAIERMIRKGIKQRRIRPVAPSPTAAALAWMTERTISRIEPDASPRSLDAVADALAAIVWRTLYP
jgi:AcrR family transcriptional regulator